MAKAPSNHFTVNLSAVQLATIFAAIIMVALISWITLASDSVPLSILGLFCQLLGSILLGLGLIKTNDELADIVRHHEKLDKPALGAHLAKDRFFIVLGVFLLALGILLQILYTQL